ncbi:hypothetical protein [Psychrobacter sp. SWN149]|uniref:hypothetical protein n=1 Tax=Psychrobacter sp. SWN149 TaxID=2792057 RepID=UPI0018CD64F1|nr:hypothetical protein [Psychrobacter sp. SWN149]MBH0006089.1 hypothetical protein [Psychrobacter sp. SWN149]
MKTVHRNIGLRLPSGIKSNQLLTSVLLSGALLLTGCQSTNLGQSNMVAAKQSPSTAKKTLAAALQKQRRQSFSYHSNLEISNEISNNQQITGKSSKPLVASDYVNEHCEETHDQAYAALILQAEKQNKDILAADYDVKRDTIRQSYFECVDAYHAWDDHQYDSDVKVAADYQALFDNYEDKPKPIDAKKAQLLDAYLLKPLSINAQGIYQPMAGKATMLASVQYQARNHHSSINQPIYVDFKNGDVYLWADNFALLNSELLDDKLGTTWRNKWLKIAIDDGTLPKGFGSELIKSHFAALDATYDAAPVGQFDYVAPTTLASLTPKLPAHQLSAMLPADQIIRRVQSFDSYQASYQSYMQIFYSRISKQYPELVKEAEPMAAFETIQGSPDLTSKAMVKKVLAMIKEQMVDDAAIDTNAIANKDVQELYGFDKRGQLKWQQMHRQLDNTSKPNTDKSLTVDVLQQYSAINTTALAFPNLPSNVQSPNASNSIDLRQYGPELLQYYQDGNGTAMGKMMFNMLPMAKERFGVIE